MERYERITDAIQRESNMNWPRAWKARLILDSNPSWADLYETLNH
jgi:putative endonuclease